MRALPFPILEKIKEYLRTVQTAYGVRPYSIMCMPQPTVKEVKGVIVDKVESQYWFGRPGGYGYWVTSYTYTVQCEDKHTRKYQTDSGRFAVGEHVICTIKDDEVIAMKKEAETKVGAAVLNRPRLLGIIGKR